MIWPWRKKPIGEAADPGDMRALRDVLVTELRGVGDLITGRVRTKKLVVELAGCGVGVFATRVPDEWDATGGYHCHVTTVVGHDQTHELCACVRGYGQTLDELRSDAIRTWLQFAGAPILMLVSQRHVYDAEHFCETDAWGVPGLHGFVGPVLLRMARPEVDDEQILRAPFFRGCDSLVTDERPHVLKVVVTSLEGGGWSRCVELDGHGGVYQEDLFDWDVPAPASSGMCIRYAVAFRGVTR